MTEIYLMLICFAAIIGYQYGKFSSRVNLDGDDLSNCCGASVVERKVVGCLSCGKECKTKKR